jgi:GTP-binding protein
VLLHLVDGTSEQVVEDYLTIIHELEAYGGVLADKPRITVLNKIDALLDEEREEKRAALAEACGEHVYEMSGVAKDGVTSVLRALKAEIGAERFRQKKAEGGDDEERGTWQP